MLKFRKKPVVIEAMQWNGRDDETGIKAALDFIGDRRYLWNLHCEFHCVI